MGRKSNEVLKYKVSIHKTGNYMYASTQPCKIGEDGIKKYSHVHWGVVDENLKFYPGKNFFYAPVEERLKLIFPPTWDLSEISRLYKNNNINNSITQTVDTAYVEYEDDEKDKKLQYVVEEVN